MPVIRSRTSVGVVVGTVRNLAGTSAGVGTDADAAMTLGLDLVGLPSEGVSTDSGLMEPRVMRGQLLVAVGVQGSNIRGRTALKVQVSDAKARARVGVGVRVLGDPVRSRSELIVPVHERRGTGVLRGRRRRR